MTVIESKNDLFSLTNGSILKYDGRELLKLKTNKDRYGTETGLLVVDMDSNEQKEIRSVNDGILLTDPNPIAFGGNTDNPSDVEKMGENKAKLQEHYNL